MTREGNRPDRRIAPEGAINPAELEALAKRIYYSGDNQHKLYPGDYGFTPPVNPWPSKSVCDDLRIVLKGEAAALFHAGLERGLTSRFGKAEIPKYIWAVDNDSEVYEAKISKNTPDAYHGYRVGSDDYMRKLV